MSVRRIVGCPGGGKSSKLTELAQRAAARYGPSNVLAVSLTKTAAAELAGRDGTILDPDSCATMHAHALRALGFDHTKLAETPAAMREFHAAHPALAPKGRGTDLEDAPAQTGGTHAQVTNHRARLTPRGEWTPEQQAYAVVWEDWCQQTGRRDFTSLVEQCLCERVPPLSRPRVILADEAQDFTVLEFELLRVWAEQTDSTVAVGDVQQCQPGDTLVRTTTGDIRLDDLDAATHQLLSFDRHDARIFGSQRRGGYEFRKASRPYNGPMLEVRSNGRSTQCTPDHRWPVQWCGPRTACCVYIMRKGNRWRVGWCQIHCKSGGGGFHLGTRSNLERADATWILSVHETRESASVGESIVAAQFGLPTGCFNGRAQSRGYVNERAIEALYAALDPDEQHLRAIACLSAHGCYLEHPIWSKAEWYARRGRRTSWVVGAGSLIPGHMKIASARGSFVDWHPIDAIHTAPWAGTVYSLEVKPHETYVADGLVTHNCIYAFRGADPHRLEQVPVARGETLTQSYRCPRAVAQVAQAWAAQLPGDPVHWTPRDADGAVSEAPYALRDTDDVVTAAVQATAGGDTAMVLATCRYMLTPLVHELRARGVAYHNPWADEPAWNPLRGGGARALLALLRPTLPDGRMWTWNDLYALTEPMQAGALQRGAKASIKEHCRTDEFGQSRGAQTVTLGTLATLVGEDVADRLLGVDRDAAAVVDWWQSVLLAKHASTCGYAARVWAGGGVDHLRPADDPLHRAPQLVAGTVHSTKGGQASHVLLAPELSKEGYYHGWLGGGAGRDSIVRLMYVAATRARETLTILEPGCPEYAPIGESLRAGVAA